MSLPFDISEKLKSVQVRHYVEWLGRETATADTVSPSAMMRKAID